MRPYRLALALAGLVVILLIIVPLFSVSIGLLVDRLWFNHIGFREIFATVLETQVGLGVCCGVGFLVVAGLNFWAAQGVARRSGYRRAITRMIEIPVIEKFPAFFGRLIWFGFVLVAWIIGQWAAGHWETYLLATHAVPITQTDPIFGIGLSFYLFRLPFLFFLYHLALIILVMSLLTAALQYFIAGGVWISPGGLGMGRNARGHLMVLGGLLFLLFAWRARLGMYDLVYAPTGLVYGAGYTDIHVGWPVLWIQLVLCVIAAIAFFAGAPKGEIRPAWYAVGGVLGVAILGGFVAPALVQRYLVAPSELEKEVPYIARNIKFTRQAYGLDRFDERDFPAIQDLTAASIEQNAATMRNLRLWDHDPQLTTFQQLQEIRTYYDFADIYYDRYTIDSELRQVSLSPRELSAQSLPDPNWVNQHLTYTHGYGLCLGPVNESTSDGLPVLFIKDIPPVSSISLKVTRPEIYYGQVANNYCLVGTGAKEFDHPSGEDNVYKAYQGSGGISLGGLWRRLILALRFGDINILISGYIQHTSRIMMYRRVLERVETLAPFLSYDSHPVSSCCERRIIAVDRRRVHYLRPISLLRTDPRWGQLHPQLRQDHYQCLRRAREALRQRPVRSVDPGLSADLSGCFSTALGDASGPPCAHSLPAGFFCYSSLEVRRVSHDGPKRLLQQGRLVARGHAIGKRDVHTDESLLRRHATTRGGEERRIHPDGSVYASAEEQHDCLDSGPLRRRRLRKGSRFHFS